MHMLEKRLQVLLDEGRWRRLTAYADERNLSVGAVVREALDKSVPASRDERRSAARRSTTVATSSSAAPTGCSTTSARST